MRLKNSPALRRGVIASILLHVGVVGALVIGMPSRSPEEPPPETEVSMVFEGGAATSMQAAEAGTVAAPADTPETTQKPPAPEPPKPQPEEPPPPPPPPRALLHLRPG